MSTPNKDTHKLGEIWQDSRGTSGTVIGYTSTGFPVLELQSSIIEVLRNISWTKKPKVLKMY
jgi:hypothetical protein